MSYVLTVYSDTAFKEYLLPAEQDSTYTLKVEKSLFGLQYDLNLFMECQSGLWTIKRPIGMDIKYHTSLKDTNGSYYTAYDGRNISNTDILRINITKKDWIAILVKETGRVFSVYQKYELVGEGKLTIGKNPNHTIIYDNSKLVSGNHAAIKWSGRSIRVIDTNSTNGTFINGKIIKKNEEITVSYGDCLDIFGLRILFFNPVIAISSEADNLSINENYLLKYASGWDRRGTISIEKKEISKELFHRSPRNLPKIETDKIEIEAPPAPRELAQQSFLMTIGPALTMALPMLAGCLLSVYATQIQGGTANLFMYTGLITALGSAIIGSFWAAIGLRNAKRRSQEEEKRRTSAYREYLEQRKQQIKSKYDRNTKSLLEMYPSATECLKFGRSSVELWNRNQRHEDFLYERIGLGSLPFQAPIEIPKERFSLIDDSLAEQPGIIKEEYRYLREVPVGVDLLEHKLVGVIGGKGKKGCYTVMNNLVVQIASNNCYTDVKMIFVFDERREDGRQVWEFTKWLPHVWSEDKKTRFIAGNKSDASDVFFELAQVLRMRAEEKDDRTDSSQKLISKPYYVLFLEDASLLEGELVTKYIYDTAEDYGISSVVMVESYEDLPNACEYIIENSSSFKGVYNVDDGEDDRVGINFDIIQSIQLEDFSRRLSGIEVKEEELGGEIPNVLSFFDLYGVNHPNELSALDRWKKNRTYESMRVPVGQKSGGIDCYLDIHEKYHGPHGLVAGTTGSGKSETLQTYMLSLAVNFSPEDVGFFVIDYKGGGMANLFDGLPHMIGQISNLSGNQVKRAMVSIKSENRRRQRIFNEYGVNNINLYTRLYKNREAEEPVPHMFIIIDEFAELKREEPDFMRELISVAQVGRSLGVHLILATQKPSGTVDDNIWSNSKFRICLRVQDRQDSMDMLHRPDAAYITQAGRSYLQVGNDELFELFQSAWSGAIYDRNAVNTQTSIAKMLTLNGKAALVGSHAQFKQKEHAKRKWIDVLIQCIDKAVEISGHSILDCVNDRILCNEVTDHVFNILENENVDFVDNEYNRQSLIDMIALYSEILNSHNGMYEKDKVSDDIIGLSSIKHKKLPEIKEKTQLDAVVEYLAQTARNNGYDHNLTLWLPVLPKIIYLDNIPGYETLAINGDGWQELEKGFSLEAVIGLSDDPENQSQDPMTIDVVAGGSHAIVGTVVSGKSTLLLTYAYSLINHYSPNMVNLYILDFSSKMLGVLDCAPHVGGIMFEEDEEKISKFFNMLTGILEERRRLFKGASYSQFTRVNGLVYPSIILMIDNVGSFRSKTDSAYDDLLLRILQEGVNYGIYVVASSNGFGLNEIPNRMGENFRTIICLEMNDKFAYTEALRTMHIDIMPEENVKGRGLYRSGDSILEFQTALPLESNDEYHRAEELSKICEEMQKAWKGNSARRIPEIPEKPLWREYALKDEVSSMLLDRRHLPIGYDQRNATVYGIDLAKTYCYMISGKQGTGKSNTLRILIQAAKMLEGALAVVDLGGDLKYAAEAGEALYIDSAKKLYDYLSSIIPTFVDRNNRKKDYAAKGYSTEEIYNNMQGFEKLFVFIWDLPEFIIMVDKPGDDIESMSPTIANLWDKGAYHNVFWFAAINPNDRAKVMGYETFKLFSRAGDGIHLGGKVDEQQLMSFDYIPYNRRGQIYKPGIGLLPAREGEDTRTVVLPLFRME